MTNIVDTTDRIEELSTQQASFVDGNSNRFNRLFKKKVQLKVRDLAIGLLIVLICGTAYTLYETKFQRVKFIYYPLWDNHTEGMDPLYYGQWQTVVPDLKLSASFGQNLGMQTVHSAVLPSGKILLASGSSWRNFKGQTELYPYKQYPKSSVGLYSYQYFQLSGNKTQNDAKLHEYFTLNNNVGIYDPKQNTFFRIPNPPTVTYKDSFQANDFFCTGHNHLPDGNILFTGGTQYYFPYRSGARTTYVFNWTKELQIDWKKLKNWNFNNWQQVLDNAESKQFYPWVYTGLMKQGRWYPSILPLTDYKLVVFGGYRGNSTAPQMYKYEMNKQIEIFDFHKFKKDPLTAWTTIDLQTTEHGPFATKLPAGNLPIAANCAANAKPDGMNDKTFERYCNNYQYDAFKLYPQNYLIKQDQIYITQQGDWNSLRETFQCCIRLTKRTYYMNLIRGQNNTIKNAKFEKGCNDEEKCPEFYRQEYVTMSGTSVQYRDFHHDYKRKIYLYGGMAMKTGGTMLPGLVSTDLYHNANSSVNIGIQYAGSRGSRKMERFDVDEKLWKKINQTYLGATYESDRVMHYATLLPTKQILIINGGNYDYFGPTLSPLLLTPLPKEARQGEIEFKRTVLAPSRKGKLYHNVALLLRDGSVWTSGGNAARALVNRTAPIIDQTLPTLGQYKFNLNKFDVNVFFKNDSTYAIGHSGNPAQSMYAQIFKPPYMFIDPTRSINVTLCNCQRMQNKPSQSDKKQMKSTNSQNHQYHLIKSNKTYTLKAAFSEPIGQCTQQEQIVLIKLSSSTHGWNSGQSLINLSYSKAPNEKVNEYLYNFNTPDAKKQLLPPAFYNIFYVDCRGKPGESVMVRFDDNTNKIFE